MTSPDLPTTAPLTEDELASTDLSFERGLVALDERYGRLLGAELVGQIVADSFRQLAARGADLPRHEDIALQFAEARLRALAEIEGAERPASSLPRVMFVCVQNAGRSQLAAALLSDRAGDAVEVHSAGSAPADRVHDAVAPVLERIGADPAAVFPKPVASELLMAADYVITMGCGDAVEAGSDTDVRDWPVADPAHADAAELERIVADLDARVDGLWREIAAAETASAR